MNSIVMEEQAKGKRPKHGQRWSEEEYETVRKAVALAPFEKSILEISQEVSKILKSRTPVAINMLISRYINKGMDYIDYSHRQKGKALISNKPSTAKEELMLLPMMLSVMTVQQKDALILKLAEQCMENL